nr:uncharacterized protein LOC117687579 isoform X2 [Crassostrea gigas]
MIWQENIEQIVMLTNLKEKARTKCVQYWPDLKMEMSCDFLGLYTTEECLYDNYVIRKLKVSHARQNESRMITQYHYTAWPDHGTPDPLCLLSFHGRLKRTNTSRNLGPILVHCSAGIGRTGTFIAIDALYEEGQKTGKVYIADYVTKMREKRMNMVQTYEQYKTIFLTLYEMFKEPTACHNTGNSIQNLQTIKNTIRSMYCESEGGSRDASSRLASLHKEHGYKMMSEEGVTQSLICPQNQKICRIRKGQMEQRKVSICENAAYNTEQADLCIYQNVEENKTNGVKVCSNTSTQEVRKSKFDIDNMDFDGNIRKKIMYGDICWRAKTNPGVNINNFEKIIGENSKNNDDGFKKEYESLPYGERYQCKTGILPENVQKNRFKTTYTYDHSRVILTNRQQDYINANYVDGTEKTDVYIAAQGPKKNTLEDFWFMIWQENIEQIVMLTNLKEKARTKCVQYWPDLKMEMSCDFLGLYTTEECLYDNYVIRKLKVSHARQNESRMITQYHYTAWPDHGTPDPLCLLSFHGRLKRTNTSRNLGPILVHCSAGIGRTGTFIAIDALYEEGQKTGKVYIADYVTKMREKRMNMVQTYEQYKTIFLTLYEMFKEPTACHNTGNSIQNLQTIKNTIRSMYCESEGGSRDASSRLASLHKEHGYKMMSEEGVTQSLICPQNQKICRIRKGQMEQRKVSICENAAYNTEQADLCIYQNVEENKTNGVKVCSNTSTQEVRKSKFDIDNMDFDGNIRKKIMYGDICWRAKTNPGVNINNFEKIIGENSKNNDDGFKKEYESLPYGERYQCKTGILPENVQKNRFKTTYTYDHSRVILTNRQQDYINANYIDGTEKTDVYIAAQGPKKNTLEDFWFMIWQENIEQIVMLTNLKEKARTKCVQYWPDLEMEMSCDFLGLYTTEECLYDNYVIRKLKVSHARQNESRMITQYHYTAWPDHGTSDPLCLLSFHGHLKRTKTSRNLGPILVHCSAGIGRTGTFIAIDALYEEGQKTGKVYIADYVTKMREKRMNMVQTYEQYKTIFLTLYEMFKEPTACHNTGNSIQNLQTIKNTIRSMYCESEGGSRDASSRLASLHKKHGYKMMSEEGVTQSLICPQNQKMLIDS